MRNLQKTIRYPTSLIIRGADDLGVELAKSLLEQGGYVIIIDKEGNRANQLFRELKNYQLFTLLDFTALNTIDDDLRRLDYVFYLQHKSTNLTDKVSSQEFLQSSNYLDSVLDLCAKFEAKFLLTTSVKAHQLTLDESTLDVNFGSKSGEQHTVYADAEIQKYAESLVKEYEEKVGIDARVIRLGEILGKELDMDSDSKLVRMLVEAIKGENIHIPGDGLDSDYYIHYLDAAYGILKAQFSNNTKGKIFTLANENEVTLLSIAYKLLELEPNAKEIIFDPNDNKLPPLKLYKPAPNLVNIGWKPRVGLERALAQSIDYLRKQLGRKKVEEIVATETGIEPPLKKRRGLKEFFRDLLFVAEKKPAEVIEKDEDLNLQGALARLISERKYQENARKGSIVLANNQLRSRMKEKREKSFMQKISDRLNLFFIFLKKRFYFLRNITLTDFIFILLFLIAFFAVYFIAIAPGLSLLRNLYFINEDLKRISAAVSVNDLEAGKNATDDLKTNLVEAQERLLELQFIFDLTQNKTAYLNYQNLLTDSIQFSTGLSDVLGATTPFLKYLSVAKPELVYRFSDADVLTANSAATYETLLDEISDSSTSLRLGIDRMQKSLPDIQSEVENLPGWIKERIEPAISQLNLKFTDFQLLQRSYEYIPAILGRDNIQHYLMIVQDNSRFTASGGEIAGFLYFEVHEGTISSLNFRTADSLVRNVPNVSEETLAEINLVSNKDVSPENTKLSDLSLIVDENEFVKAVSEYYRQATSRQIDMIIFANLEVLETFLRLSGNIEYKQTIFNSDNYLANINLLLGSEPTAANKNEVIVNLFAKVLELRINAPIADRLNLFPQLSRLRESGDFRLSATDIDLRNYINATNRYSGNTKDQLLLGLNYLDTVIKVDKFPTLNVGIKLRINSDLSTSKSVTVSAAGVDELQNLYICLPNGSSGLQYADVEQILVSTAFSVDKVCNIFLKDDDLSYQLTYNTVPFENKVGNIYNYSLELIKSSGIGANYELEVSADSSLTLIPEDQGFIQQGNAFLYKGELPSNLRFSFEIR